MYGLNSRFGLIVADTGQGKQCTFDKLVQRIACLTEPSAEEFDVTLPFLLQQVAWLYDRQLSQVRAQMRRVGTTHSASPSPGVGSVAGSGTLGGQPMRRVGSGGEQWLLAGLPVRLR